MHDFRNSKTKWITKWTGQKLEILYAIALTQKEAE